MKPLRFTMYLTAALVLVLWCFNPAMASSKDRDDGFFGHSEKAEINMTVPGKTGMSITIEHSFGDINVRKGGTTIRITGEKRVSAKSAELAREFLAETELRVEQKRNGVKITTYYPEDEYKKRDRNKIRNFSISYTIEIPDDTHLSINSSFGDLDINGVTGELDVGNEFGDLDVNDIGGDVTLYNKFGDLTAHNITGDATLKNEHGDSSVTNITGTLTTQSSFSSLEADNIGGETTIKNTHGEIELADVRSKAYVETSFSPLKVTNVNGPAELRNSHGTITAEVIHGNTEINTRFARVNVSSVKGDLSITTQHSGIETSNITGDATIETSFGTVTLKRIGGNIRVTNQHGAITATDIFGKNNGPSREIRFQTSFAGITLEAPENLSADFNSSTTFGKIKTDHPVTMTLSGTVGTGNNTSSIEGTIGSGSPKHTITLNTTHGSIMLEEAEVGNWKPADFFNPASK